MSEKQSHEGPDGTIYDMQVGSNGSVRFMGPNGQLYEGKEPLKRRVVTKEEEIINPEENETGDINMELVKGMVKNCGIDEATAIARVKAKQYGCP